MSEKRDHGAELRRVFNALAQAAIDAPDEEVLAGAREEGIDPEAAAQELRALLRKAVTKKKHQRLLEARNQHQEEVKRLRSASYDLPEAASERRSLLELVFAAQPQMQQMLTAQHRELHELTDADVESTLRKLAELGILDDVQHDRDRE